MRGLKLKIHEVVAHPAMTGMDEEDAAWREEEVSLFTDAEVKEAVRESGVRLMGWREMRDFQRESRVRREKGGGER
ncbi:MAG: hypothetical protein AB1742_00960 [bacterium]